MQYISNEADQKKEIFDDKERDEGKVAWIECIGIHDV